MRKAMAMVMALLALRCGVAAAAGESHGYRQLDEVELNGNSVSFYLDQACPNGAAYWRLDPRDIDVDKGYALLLAALGSGKKIYLIYQDDPAAREQCLVKRINVR